MRWGFMDDVLGRPGRLGQHTVGYQVEQAGDTTDRVGREKKTETGLACQPSPPKEDGDQAREGCPGGKGVTALAVQG